MSTTPVGPAAGTTPGSTDGGYGSSATTRAAHDLFMALCDKLLAELDKVGPALKAWVDRFIDHYGGQFLPDAVKDWIKDKIDWLFDQINNELWPRLRDATQRLCQLIATDILPWLLAPQTLLEVSGKWQDVATDGKTLSGKVSKEKLDAIGYPISEWSGSGSEQYAATITSQHDFSVALADVSDQMATTLSKTSSDLLDAELGLTLMAAGLVGAVASLVGALATAETGVGAVIGVICAIISMIVAVIGALIGGISAVKTMLFGAADRVEELRDKVETLVAANGGSWPTPNRTVGGSGGMPGKDPWDDGV